MSRAHRQVGTGAGAGAAAEILGESRTPPCPAASCMSYPSGWRSSPVHIRRTHCWGVRTSSSGPRRLLADAAQPPGQPVHAPSTPSEGLLDAGGALREAATPGHGELQVERWHREVDAAPRQPFAAPPRRGAEVARLGCVDPGLLAVRIDALVESAFTRPPIRWDSSHPPSGAEGVAGAGVPAVRVAARHDPVSPRCTRSSSVSRRSRRASTDRR